MKHSKQEQLLIQKEEELIKHMLHNLYQRKTGAGSPSGGSIGGNGFTDFMHGFLTPMKQFGSLLNEVVPGVGTVLSLGASGIDKMIPGHQYETISDAFAGRHIQGTGGKPKGKVGRPRKVQLEIPVTVVKRRGRPRKP